MSEPLRPQAVQPQDLAPPRTPARPVPAGPDLKQAAAAFEGMVMSMMLQSMRKTVQPSGLLGDSGQARGTLDYLLDQAIVDSAVKGGRSWGLAARLEAAWSAKAGAADARLQQTGQVGRPAGR